MHDKATLPALAGALVLTIVLACAWTTGTYMVLGSYEDFVRNQGPQPYHSSEWVEVTATGDPLIAATQHLSTTKELLNVDRSAFPSDPPPVLAHAAELTDDRGLGNFGWRSREGRFVFIQPSPRNDALSENWYFVMDDVQTGRGWLEGYDRVTSTRIGYIGRKGQSASIPAVADRFTPAPGPILRLNARACLLQWHDFLRLYGELSTTAIHFNGKYPLADRQCVILDDAGVHLVDLDKRTASLLVSGPVDGIAPVSLLEPLPEGFVIDDPQDVWKDDRRFLLKMFVAVRTQEAIQLFDIVRDERTELQLPQELQSGDIHLVLLSDGSGVAKRYLDEPARPVGNGVEAGKFRLTWFKPDGQVMRQQDVEYWRNTSTISTEGGMLLGVAAVPEPLVSAVVVGLITASTRLDPAAAGLSQRLRMVLRATWPAIVLALFSGALAAWLLDRHRRHRRLPRSRAWLAFALLLGLPGYLGYVWHRRWSPVQLAAPPERTGIEIIAA